MTAVANSGPEEPAAIKVAPATSGGKFNTKIKYNNFLSVLKIHYLQMSLGRLPIEIETQI